MYSDEELLEDIRAVANVVDRSPSLQDYRDHGEYSVTTIYRRFDSWQNAVARAGFEPRDPNTRTPNADLIDALQELADELGESPTTHQMDEHGRYWSKVYRDRFGSWGDALDAAGLDPIDHNVSRRVSDEDLLDELERLDNAVDGTPTSTQMKEKGAYSPDTYWRHFGSWRAAVDEVGLAAADLEVARDVTNEELLDELERLADAVDGTPTSAQMISKGAYNPETYRKYFGSWNAALEAIGHEPHHQSARVAGDELLADIQRLSEEFDRRPTATDIIEHGNHGIATYQRRFGSWSAALEEAGFDPDADRVSDEELLDDLQRLHEELDKVPSILDVEAESAHSPTTYQNRFGSWSAALDAAGFDPDREPTDEELLAELRRLRDELDKEPSMRDMTEHGAYGSTTYTRHFGSWSNAKDAAFEDGAREE